MIKNPKNFSKIFDFLPKMVDFWPLLTVENLPGILDRNFWFWTVIFPKIHQKILTERSALLKSDYSAIQKLN